MTTDLTLEEAIASIERKKLDPEALLTIKPTKIMMTSDGVVYEAALYIENPAIENDWRRLGFPESLIVHIKRVASIPR